MMKDYKNYSIDDFINDDNFIKWVKFPDSEINQFWKEFLIQNPEKQPDVEQAVQFLKLFQDRTPRLASDKLLKMSVAINDRLDVPVSASMVHQIVDSRARTRWVYRYAAVIVTVFVAFASWRGVKLYAVNEDKEFSAPVAVEDSYSAGHVKEHIVPKGKRSKITLEDGTQVWLNADSKLKFSPNFLKGITRDVYLEGEAYFDVTSDKSHPFIVHVQGVEIKVLGTSFNVKGYNEDSSIEATLVHGKISVDGDSAYDKITLAAKQRAIFHKHKKDVLVENNVETDSYTSWRQGILVFEDQPLHEIFPLLERTFNVDIHTDEAFSLDCRFTAKIHNKSLDEVLELFRTSDTIEYSIVGSNVFIKGSFCNE
jgi:transmembrane sensor